MANKLRHKALAELHNFVIAFAFGIKIGTALAAADGKSGQRILKDLLESKEFQN